MRSKFLRRKAYGLDVEGDVYDSEQKNIEETSEPQDQHQTPHNTVNSTRDVEAEKEFPEIRPHSNRFPTRSPRG